MGRLIEVDADELKKLLNNTEIELTNNIMSIVRENYIPKEQYENRLNTDLEAILVDLQLEIEEKATELCDDGWWLTYNDIIQQKIDKLKEDNDV
jgi:hypothetical protein